MDPDADTTTSTSAAAAILPSALPPSPLPEGADPSRPDAQDPSERGKQQHHNQQGNGSLAGFVGGGRNPPPPGSAGGGRMVRTIDAELEALRDKGIARESRTKFNSAHTDLATMEDWYQNLRHQEEEMRRKKMDAERVLHSYQNNEFVPTNRPKPQQQKNASPSPTVHLEGDMGTECDDDRPGDKRNGEGVSPKDISPIISRFDQLSKQGDQYVSIGTSSSNLASEMTKDEEDEEEAVGGKTSEDMQKQSVDASEAGADQITPSGMVSPPTSGSISISSGAAVGAASAATDPVVASEERDHAATQEVDAHRMTEGWDDFQCSQRQQQLQRPSPVTPTPDSSGLLSARSAACGGSEASGDFSAAPNVGRMTAPSAPSPAHAPLKVPVRVSLGVLVREENAEALLRFPVEDMRAHQSSSPSSSSSVTSLHIVENVLATMTEVVRDYCASLGDGGLASIPSNRRNGNVAKYDPMFTLTIAGLERDASYPVSDGGTRSAIARCIMKIVVTIVFPSAPSLQPDRSLENNGYDRGEKDARVEAIFLGVVEALKESVASGRFVGTAKGCPAQP